MKIKFLLMTLFTCCIAIAQNTVSGTVTNNKSEPLEGVNVKIVGDTKATITDADGKFSINTSKKLPLKLEFSAVGFNKKTETVDSNNQKINVSMTSEETKLDEIVVSASRTPERVLESPVTIERMGIRDVKNTTAVSFYEGMENMKEVHFNTSSMSFKSINTRGFATVANTRFMQLVDGMDNSSPALNFVLGNLIGLSDLDVASIELLPGASSALYGANAFNGILFMNSKNPFTHQGISAYAKYGKTSQEAAGTNDYKDFGIRAAKAFTKHFAVKANFNYLEGTEWVAADTRNVTNGNITSNPDAIGHAANQNYDGLNLYGDEVTTFIKNVGNVSRTGYREQDLSDNKVNSVKGDFSVHVKPFNNDIEFIAQYKLGFGNTIYQGANRYYLKDFFMSQTRFEVKGKNFFVRAYMSEENAGNSYDMRFAAWNVNRAAKSDLGWFTDYATAFQLSSATLGLNATQAAAYARNFADNNVSPGLPLTPNGSPRLVPGTAGFNNALNTIIKDSDFTKGAKFIDRSKINHADVNYNFKDIIKVAEIQVGGSARQYVLNSEGSIFTDYDGPIRYEEFGVYTQVQKKFMDDRLKFTGSVRYDKSKNFEGNFSPRVSFVYSAGESKKHNFRVSYQTGFRNPTTQDQYIGLDLGPFALIGSAAENLDRYSEVRTLSAAGALINGSPTTTMTGQNAYYNSYTSASVAAFAAANGDTSKLVVATPGLVKPEKVQAFELGYRSVIKDFSIDISGYYNMYNDFMNTANVIAPLYGNVNGSTTDIQKTYAALANGDRRVFQVYTNSKSEVKSFGAGIGLSKKVYKDFEVGANYNYADFKFDQDSDPSFELGFNTPKHRIKGSFGNAKLFKNFGFNVNVRWNNEYLWQSSFVDGYVPENTVLDAQINYGIPSMKSVFKVSASNLFGKDYIQVVGAGAIGQTIMFTWTVNP